MCLPTSSRVFKKTPPFLLQTVGETIATTSQGSSSSGYDGYGSKNKTVSNIKTNCHFYSQLPPSIIIPKKEDLRSKLPPVKPVVTVVPHKTPQLEESTETPSSRRSRSPKKVNRKQAPVSIDENWLIEAVSKKRMMNVRFQKLAQRQHQLNRNCVTMKMRRLAKVQTTSKPPPPPPPPSSSPKQSDIDLLEQKLEELRMKIFNATRRPSSHVVPFRKGQSYLDTMTSPPSPGVMMMDESVARSRWAA